MTGDRGDSGDVAGPADRDGAARLDDETAREFERHRPRLLGIAYRLLGSMWDAEDVVAEALLRWARTDRATVREPAAYLTTVVSRLALDQLRSARATRETYMGPWLPEPALTDDGALGPLDTVERRESVSLATLHLLERLTPPERAVFVLREVFDVPYEQVAAVLDVTEPGARQLLRRARQRIGGDARRSPPDAAEHERLFERFLRAFATGDLDELRDVLAADAVAYSDGGGKVRAVRRPVVGADAIVRFAADLHRRFAVGDVRRVEANGQPAAVLRVGDLRQVLAVDVRDGRIRAVYGIANPDKVRYALDQLARSA